MKKKIIVGVFSLLILITAIVFIIGAIYSYNYDIKYHGDDKLAGFGSVVFLMIGGFVVFYEADLFYTVYYFFVKPEMLTKSVLNILSNLTLLTVIFTDHIAHFLFKYVSEIFGEEIIVLSALLFIYVVLRIICVAVSVRERRKERV